MSVLASYNQLRQKVEALCLQIESNHSAAITCHAGCDSCCRSLTLFPVEAYALASALAELPLAEAEIIRARARTADPEGPCPLLADGRCLLYHARPIICRTHGLPILLREQGEPRVDFCPMNFEGYESLPGNALIDLDRLNEILTAVNRDFVDRVYAPGTAPDRIPIREALLLPWPPE